MAKNGGLTLDIDRLRNARVLCIGDVMLDRYIWGDAERISQEAPVILLRADRREERLGGASSVATMLRALVACGWFGIQTWIGGQAIHSMLQIFWPAWRGFPGGVWICVRSLGVQPPSAVRWTFGPFLATVSA